MAFTLILLICWAFFQSPLFVWMAMGVLAVGMAVPQLFRPLAWAWFSLAFLLGRISSAVLLCAVYILVLLPVALLRRLMGRDDLRLKSWKSGTESCFIARDHWFGPADFRHPY